MTDLDFSINLQEQINHALAEDISLNIQGNNTKAFIGRRSAIEAAQQVLSTNKHRGIINYEPSELVLTARSGTPLKEIEKILADNGQMLGFEPPYYGDQATLGGTVACNLSGPRRAYSGAVRDFVLGIRLINGKGEHLRFGGEVMKNVAGYDVSRLQCGAMGTLGVLTEISLKVLPLPEYETTLSLSCPALEGLNKLHAYARQPLPISASCHDGEQLYIRLSGTKKSVITAFNKIGGERLENASYFWHQLKEQRLAFFAAEHPLWRLSLASTAPPLHLPGKCLYEWGGALRWIISPHDSDDLRDIVASHNGHATLLRNKGDQYDNVFHPLSSGMRNLHFRIKDAMDPQGIFNSGRMYAGM